MRVKDILTKASKIGGGAITLMAVESYFRGLKKDLIKDPITESVYNKNRHYEEMWSEIQESYIDNNVKINKIRDIAKSHEDTFQKI